MFYFISYSIFHYTGVLKIIFLILRIDLHFHTEEESFILVFRLYAVVNKMVRYISCLFQSGFFLFIVHVSKSLLVRLPQQSQVNAEDSINKRNKVWFKHLYFQYSNNLMKRNPRTEKI